MAADIEFNVRNGMTVGANKHLVLDVNGALSGSDITCTTGRILSGGSDLLDVFGSSDVATTVASNSGNWHDTYTHVQSVSDTWGGADGYTTDIGNNSDTTIEVTHNLNTSYITYSLIDNNTNEFVNTQTSIVDANKIQFVFTTAPTTNEYKVVIISTDGTATGGGGGSGGTSYTDSDVASYLNGNLDTHIIPDTNAAYDLGNAEYKIRHLFLSDNSIYMGDDNTPIRLDSNKKLLVDGTEVGGAINTYTKATLPLNASAATNALVTDGTIDDTPTMSYFYNGSWYRTFDNSKIVDQTVDVFLIAGQSNAHGWADIENGLSTAQATQDGIFYTSWHDHTSNASDPQYYSDWTTSLVAGYTRGDSGESTLEGSDYFGPELGFVDRGDVINLTSGQPIGILKYAVGSSALVDDPDDSTGGTSDWDINATGNRRGDALRGFKLAVDDAINKLNNAGYTYRLAGMIWWQQMSPTVQGRLI